MSPLILPQKSMPYILYQRTEYLSDQTVDQMLRRVTRRWPSLQHVAVLLESFLYRSRLERLFNEDMQQEAEMLRPHLPESCHAVLDIGCGVAGVEAALRPFFPQDVQIYLLDKTQVDERVYYKFEQKGSFYSSLEIAKQLLVANGYTAAQIHLEEATEQAQITAAPQLDLVLSLISWGFHYPVSIYLERVHELLRVGGRLILDVRKDTDGEMLLRQRFTSVQRIREDKRGYRLLAIK